MEDPDPQDTADPSLVETRLLELQDRGVETGFIETAFDEQYYIYWDRGSLTTSVGVTFLNEHADLGTVAHESAHYFMQHAEGADLAIKRETEHLLGTPLGDSDGNPAGQVTAGNAERAAGEVIARHVEWQVSRQSYSVDKVRIIVSDVISGETSRAELGDLLNLLERQYEQPPNSNGAFSASGYSSLGGTTEELTILTPPLEETTSWIDSNMLKGHVYSSIYEIPEVRDALAPLGVVP